MISSDSFAVSPIDVLAGFDSIWHVDFEFRQDANLNPIPLCMFAKEQRSGAKIFLWREQLLALTAAPFPTGPRDIMAAYRPSAEMLCFSVLEWSRPYNVLDLMTELRVQTNGLTIEGLRSQTPSQHPGSARDVWVAIDRDEGREGSDA